MPAQTTVVTGPIVGLQSTWLLEETVEFAAALGIKIAVFDLFQEILRLGNMTYKNQYERALQVGRMLDGYQYQFDAARQNAYRSIAAKIAALPKNTHAAIRLPASIEWRGVNIELKDHRIIAETLKPDRIVTLIDAEWKIAKRLQSRYGRHVLKVIAQSKELSTTSILRWLGSEVSRSEDLAEWCQELTGKQIRHWVLATQTPRPSGRGFSRDVDNLTKVLTVRELTAFYASYSMTVATPKERRIIADAIWKLREYALVIDPGSIEIGGEMTDEERPTTFAYTVFRDLRWDVQKVDAVAAFHPYETMPPLSTGMMDELGHARAFGKERYLVLSSGGGSPFTGDNYVQANHIFARADDLFQFLERKRRPLLKPRFAKQVESFRAFTRHRSSGAGRPHG